MNCMFCKIISHEITSKKLYEDKNLIVINDINPIAKKHILIITKKHLQNLNTVINKNYYLIHEIIKLIPIITKKLNIDSDYKIIINNGLKAGQMINHMHIHILGGEDISKLKILV